MILWGKIGSKIVAGGLIAYIFGDLTSTLNPQTQLPLGWVVTIVGGFVSITIVTVRYLAKQQSHNEKVDEKLVGLSDQIKNLPCDPCRLSAQCDNPKRKTDK